MNVYGSDQSWEYLINYLDGKQQGRHTFTQSELRNLTLIYFLCPKQYMKTLLEVDGVHPPSIVPAVRKR